MHLYKEFQIYKTKSYSYKHSCTFLGIQDDIILLNRRPRTPASKSSSKNDLAMRTLFLLLGVLCFCAAPILAQDDLQADGTSSEIAIPTTPSNNETTSTDDVLNMPSNWDKLKEEKRLRFLFAAVDRGDVTLAQTMLSDIDLAHYRHNNDGETLLTLAIRNGNYEMVEWLMETAVVNLKNEEGETPLTLALKKQNIGIVEEVLARAKADLPNDFDETPLMLAVNYNYDVGMIKTLIDKGAKPNRLSNGVTPLSRAVEKGNVRMAALLIGKGAEPSIRNKNGELALYQAVAANQPILAGLLLHKSEQPGVDANWETPMGETLVNLAVSNENTAMVRVLVDGGADVNATDYLENTPLNLAAERGMAEVTNLLLEAGANPDHANIMGTTPIMAAAQRGHDAIATTLASYGADPEQRDYEGIAANDYGNYSGSFSDPYIQGEVETLLLEYED